MIPGNPFLAFWDCICFLLISFHVHFLGAIGENIVVQRSWRVFQTNDS